MKQISEKLNRTIIPAPHGDISFSLPDFERYEFENGLKILFVRKEKLPAVQITLMTEAGGKFDPSRKKGLTQLLAALMDEGAGEYDSLSLSGELELLGSALSVSAGSDFMYVSLLTLEENLERSFGLFSAVLTSPHLNESDFNREKSKMLTRILQVRDDAAYLAHSNFNRIVYGLNHPYSLPETGTTETLEAVSIEDVRNYYRSQFTPSNSTMIVVGDTDLPAIKVLTEKYLHQWHSGKPSRISIEGNKISNKQIYLVRKDDAVQTELRIGHPAGTMDNKDYFSKMIMNTILGGQFSSRINLNLREDKGYTYGVRSGFSYNMQAASFSVSAAVKSENTGDAIFEIIKELNGIRTEIFEKELRFAKSSIIRKFPAQFETLGQIAGNLGTLVMYGLEDDYFNTYVGNVKKTNLEDVHEAAVNNIFPEQIIILAVGNPEILLPQLKTSGAEKIIELDIDGNII